MTLLEVLTGMMVSVMLIGTAFSTFWVATASWEKAKRRSEMLRLLDGVSDLMTRQLRTIQPPFHDLLPTFLAYNDGDETYDFDSMAFVTSANPRFPPELAMSDLCEVEFYIETGAEEDPMSGMMGMGAGYDPLMTMSGEGYDAATAAGTAPTPTGGLWMRIDPTPDDDLESGGYLVDLGLQIVSFNLRFFDGVEWIEDWLDDSQVPQAVEFTLVCADPENRENPMTVTRLVRMPTCRMINDGAQNMFAGAGDTSSGTDTGGGYSSSGQGSSGSGSSEMTGGGTGTGGGAPPR